MPQPRRLVREQPERSRVRLREAERREPVQLEEHVLGRLAVDAAAERALDEPPVERLDRLLAPLAAHRAPQPFGLPHGEPGERDRDREHLLLEDDHAERLPQRLLQQRMVVRRHELRVLTQALAVLDVRVHGAALDRARPDERDLHRQVVEVLRPRSQERLHLRAALDLEDADRVRVLDLGVDVPVVERNPRQVDRLAVGASDPLDAVLDRRQHPETEQVDLEEACVGARVLVPLAQLPPGHRRRLHRHELDERAGRDHHPARVLRDVARQAAELAAEPRERAPARRRTLRVGVGQLRELLADAVRVPVRQPRQPLELGERQPERLADVADRPARVVRREARDESRMLAAVALADLDDQLLADVAREVEVDVRHRDELPVEEAAERQARLHRVDVREPSQVADDRADRASATAARRQDVPRDRLAAHLARALAGELEHLPVEQEEAGQPELVDQRELLVEPRPRLALVAVRIGIARCERAVANASELHARRLAAVGEVGVAVAEVLRQVELEALGKLACALDCFAVEREALRRLVRREQDALVVAAPLGLAAVERRPAANRDEDVLELGPPLVVRVRVAGHDRPYAEVLGEVAESSVSPLVPSLVRPLELDEEALAPECACERRGAVRVPDRESAPRTAGEADEPFVQLGEQRRVERRGQRLGTLLRTRARVGCGQQAAEVRVAGRRLHQQRHVRAIGQRDLRPRDGPDAECLRCVRELERAVKPVMVGQRERLVAELGRPGRELFGQRGAVQERIG